MIFRILKIIIFPVFIWELCGKVLNPIRFRFYIRATFGRFLFFSLHLVIFILIGLPVIALLTSEIIIALNYFIVGSESGLVYTVGKKSELAHVAIDLPGKKKLTSENFIFRDRSEATINKLIETYAPVLIQKVSYRPEWDIPVFIDFDGNDNPRDNVVNEPMFRPLTAGVYGELTAETSDSYYLLYSLYHIKDYDHPVRQLLKNWTFHDNDNEGWMIRVDKKDMKIHQLSAWFHNRFFLANRNGEMTGPEPIQGKIFFENEHHPIIYCTAMGHGVQAAQMVNEDIVRGSVKIFRHQALDNVSRDALIDRSGEYDLTYQIRNFDNWYRFARGPLGVQGKGTGMFEGRITLGQSENGMLSIGRYIASHDYKKHKWSRPKPPWSWDDGWDDVPIFMWHFFPSYAFESHYGIPLSHRYVYNRPVEKVFNCRPEELLPNLQLKKSIRTGNKWNTRHLDERFKWEDFSDFTSLIYKKYINRVFRLLG